MKAALLASAASVHTQRWAPALAARGFEVLVCSLEPPPAGALDGLPGVRAITLPAAPLPGFARYPLAMPALAGALAAFAPDLLDAHFVPNYGLMGALSGRRPLSVNCWGSDLLTARDPLRRARARWVLGRADRVFTDAENLGAAARALGADPARLRVIPWGVETARFAYSAGAAARAAARAAWPPAWRGGARAEDPVVVSTRVLHPIYAVDTLVRAWPAVARAAPGARCLVAGDGPLRPALEQLARDGGAASSLAFLGRLAAPDLAALLAGADVYVSTSLSDSTSISLLEAMSAGAYPVVSDIAGNREWVTPQSAGLFPVHDADALARAVVATLGDPAARAAARAANRRTVETRGDRDRAMDRIAGELRAMAAAHAQRPR